MALVFSLCACANAAILPAEFDKAALETAAKEVVQMAGAGDYAAVIERIKPELQGNVTAAQLEEGWGSTLEKIGEHKEYTAVSIFGQKNTTTGEIYAVVVVVSRHEDGNSQYTLSYDAQMNLTGLYLK